MADHANEPRDQDRAFTELWSEHRAYLVDLAFRMTGNIQDAEDVVQEAFSRLLDRDLATIDDARGWLVVVVSRICLDQLRSARKRREISAPPAEDSATVDLGSNAARNAPLRGRTVIAPNLLRFFGPRARVTLVSQPINGNPGVLAFRDQELVAMLQLKTRDGLIYDLHAIRDPDKLAF